MDVADGQLELDRAPVCQCRITGTYELAVESLLETVVLIARPT